jgi:hypothetical protein
MYRTNYFHRYMVVLVLFSFLIGQLGFADVALAGWDDKSDDLPGMSDGEFYGKVALIAGVAIVTVLILKAGSKKKDDKKKEEEQKKEDKQSLQTGSLQETLFAEATQPPVLPQPKVIPYMGLSPSAASGGGPAVTIGLAVNF